MCLLTGCSIWNAVSHRNCSFCVGLSLLCTHVRVRGWVHFGCRYNKRELLGKNISELVPEPMAGKHQTYMEAFLSSGRSVVRPFQALLPKWYRLLFRKHVAHSLVPAPAPPLSHIAPH